MQRFGVQEMYLTKIQFLNFILWHRQENVINAAKTSPGVVP